MENKYIYSLLKYKHSPLLGESLNLGLLVYFTNENRLHFLYSKNLSRVKSVYSNIPEKIIRNYLREIGNKIELLNNKIDELFINEIENRFELFVNDYILPRDESSLQFDDKVVGFQYSNSNNKIVKYLRDLFLHVDPIHKVDKEYEIGIRFYRAVKQYVKEVGKSDSPNFYKDYKVKNTTGVEFNFKYAWQNGSLNLVKPLNFDLSESRHIASKAHQNYGLFVDLKNVADERNLRYDLIIGEPTKKGLVKEFDHALNLLGNLEKVHLISENGLEKYTQKLIRSISD